MQKKSPNAIDVHVGSRVRIRRTVMGMSQEKLGESLGVSFQQVQKYEKGTNRIGASRLQRMADVLKVPVSFFFEGGLAGNTAVTEVSHDPIMDFVTTREGVTLITAFSAIEDRKVRQTILNLVRSLSAAKTTVQDAEVQQTAI